MSCSIVFMFSGQGSQYFGMAHRLYDSHPLFQKTVKKLDALVISMTGASVIASITSKRIFRESFSRTLFTHPAIFIIEYGLALILVTEGIVPHLTIGTSLGEFASATISGIISVEDALEAIIVQAQSIEKLCRPGGMLSIFHDISLYDRSPFLRDHTELASVFTGTHFVVSGDENSIRQAMNHLDALNVNYKKLPVSHAFHSAHIDPASQSCKNHLSAKTCSSPDIPHISCVTGKHTSAAIPATYFWEIARKPVLFSKALCETEKFGPHIYVDLGPGGSLAGLVSRSLPLDSKSTAVSIVTQFNREMEKLEELRTLISKWEPKLKGSNKW